LTLLLDENVPRPLRRFLSRYDITTVADRGWESIKNGALLNLIEAERFDIFLTGDKNFAKQQNMAGRQVALVVMSATNWPVIRPHLPAISRALELVQPGTVITVECGAFVPRKFGKT